MSANLNTTMNGTQPSSCSFNPTAEKIGKTFAYCLLFVISLAGNSFIGIIVYKTKTMRKPINFLIVNMAMSDLLFSIFLFPQQLTQLYVDSWLISGPLGQTLCKMSYLSTFVSAGVSIQSLVLIAVNRFGAVVFPLRCPLISSKLCPFFIVATWIIAMAIHSPYLFASNNFEHQGGLMCVWDVNEVFGAFSSFKNYTITIYVIVCYTPLVLIAVLYIMIIVKLKSQKTPGEQSANAGQQRARRERNVLKMSIAIVLAFAVCWLPFSTGIILALFESDTMTWSCGFTYFMTVSLLMLYGNCAINPCICFIFSGNYRQGLKKLLRCI